MSAKSIRRSKRIAAQQKVTKRAKLAPKADDDDEYRQVVLWQGAPLDNAREALELLSNAYSVRVKLITSTRTLPGNGGQGGRFDVLFRVHGVFLARFATSRFQMFKEETTSGRSFIHFPIDDSVDAGALFDMLDGELRNAEVVLETPRAFIASFDLWPHAVAKPYDARCRAAKETMNTVYELVKRIGERWPICGAPLALDGGCMRWWTDVRDTDEAALYSQDVHEAADAYYEN